MNKTVVISGGSSGIGLATTKQYLDKGARVIVAARNKNKFESNLDSSKENLRFIETDFNDMDSVKKFYSTIKEEYKTVDIAINNVGLAIMKPLTDFQEEEFDKIINVNLKSLWLSMKYQISLMKKDSTNDKHIINISSINGLGGSEYLSIYSAAKAGVISLTKSAALELAKSKISINAIVPGPFDTPMLNEALLTQAQGDQRQKEIIEREYKQFIPKGRFGNPVEVANTIFWLSEGNNNFISGHSLIIDGGITSRYR